MPQDETTELKRELDQYLKDSLAVSLPGDYDIIIGPDQDNVLSAGLMPKAKEKKPSDCDLRIVSPLKIDDGEVILKKPNRCPGVSDGFSTGQLNTFMQRCAKSQQNAEWLLDTGCVIAWTGDLREAKKRFALALDLVTDSLSDLKSKISHNLGIVGELLGGPPPLGGMVVLTAPLAAKVREYEGHILSGGVSGVTLVTTSEFELLTKGE
jgi:hypothetical protein